MSENDGVEEKENDSFLTRRLLWVAVAFAVIQFFRVVARGGSAGSAAELIGMIFGAGLFGFLTAVIGKSIILLFKGDESIKSELPEDHPHNEG